MRRLAYAGLAALALAAILARSPTVTGDPPGSSLTVVLYSKYWTQAGRAAIPDAIADVLSEAAISYRGITVETLYNPERDVVTIDRPASVTAITHAQIAARLGERQ